MGDTPPSWTLDRFLAELDSWIEREGPNIDLRLVVTAWILSRTVDPFGGARREPGFDNLWSAVVPDSGDGAGQVVACSYWVEVGRHVVRCNSFALLSWPI